MNVPVPMHHQPNQFDDDSSAMPIISIITWTIGAMVAVGVIIMFAKCLLSRQHPPCPPCPRPTTSRPPREEPLYPEPMYPLYPGTIGVAPPRPLPPGPPPPQANDPDLEQGSISERADRTTESSKVGNQPRVPPPPYCRWC
ncbi:hypothetical protein FPCIR_11511 [Fusarium pseudocircinatum]|uniref:Uncharacterized protein n=1 Tax=Fusarium pseudocircinatum TaxID=56676 RepID=A0A8H5NVM8_9HYPO|nr:hypothetical protein FPCIR_11511 [Fusarium pseudocircinatum]